MRHLVLLAFVLFGCNGSSVTYADQAGRHCKADGLSATCDQTPQPSQACTADFPNACWSIFDNFPDAGPTLVENCASCCDTNGNAATKEQDCTPIVCKSVGDCPLSANGCQSGVCTVK